MTKRRVPVEDAPEIRIKPNSYQPSKAEREEAVHIDASPDDLIRAAFQPVRVIEDRDA